jgi:hypothetical protein
MPPWLLDGCMHRRARRRGMRPPTWSKDVNPWSGLPMSRQTCSGPQLLWTPRARPPGERVLLVSRAPRLWDLHLHAIRPHAAPSEGPGVGVYANHALDQHGGRYQSQHRADWRPPSVQGVEDGVEDGEGAVLCQGVQQPQQPQRAEGKIYATAPTRYLNPCRNHGYKI